MQYGDENCCFWQNRGFEVEEKNYRFSTKYDTGSKGEFQNKRNPLDIFEYFLSDIWEHIAEQIKHYAQQKFMEKLC